MIKPNELRLKNWLEFPNGETAQVEAVDNNSVCIFTNQGKQFGLTAIEPIPLTEEWLIKFCFKKHNNCCYTITENDEHKSEFTILYDADLKLFKVGVQRFWYEIKTVHSLQNLYFALTGEELIIK